MGVSVTDKMLGPDFRIPPRGLAEGRGGGAWRPISQLPESQDGSELLIVWLGWAREPAVVRRAMLGKVDATYFMPYEAPR